MSVVDSGSPPVGTPIPIDLGDDGPHAGLLWLVTHLQETLERLVFDHDDRGLLPDELRERARAAYKDGMVEEFDQIRNRIRACAADDPGLVARGLTGSHLELKLWLVRSHLALYPGLVAGFDRRRRRRKLTVMGIAGGDKSPLRRWFADHLERIDVAFESLLKALQIDGLSAEFKQVLEAALRWL